MLVLKCIYPKSVFAKCTQLACLLSFASLFTFILPRVETCYHFQGGFGSTYLRYSPPTFSHSTAVLGPYSNLQQKRIGEKESKSFFSNLPYLLSTFLKYTPYLGQRAYSTVCVFRAHPRNLGIVEQKSSFLFPQYSFNSIQLI